MLSDYAKFSQNGLTIEANFNENVKPCEVFRFTIDGKSVYIDRAYIYQTLLLFGDEDQKEQLIPVTETTVKPIKRLLKVRAKEDVKKGDTIAVMHTVYVPVSKEEKIRLTPQESQEWEKIRRESLHSLSKVKPTQKYGT